MAVASLVLGLVSLVMIIFVIAPAFGVLALIFGVIGMGKVKKGQTRKHRGLAIAGIVTGAIGLLGGIAYDIAFWDEFKRGFNQGLEQSRERDNRVPAPLFDAGIRPTIHPLS